MKLNCTKCSQPITDQEQFLGLYTELEKGDYFHLLCAFQVTWKYAQENAHTCDICRDTFISETPDIGVNIHGGDVKYCRYCYDRSKDKFLEEVTKNDFTDFLDYNTDV